MTAREDGINMDLSNIQIGEVYRIHHRRKGQFVAQVIGVEQADPGDLQDRYFVTVKYDVRVGTDQANLSIEIGKQQVRVSNLRPSLVDSIDHLEGENWLRMVRVAEENRPAKPVAAPERKHQAESISKRLARRLGLGLPKPRIRR